MTPDDAIRRPSPADSARPALPGGAAGHAAPGDSARRPSPGTAARRPAPGESIRHPSPGAKAASRARRIGGRPATSRATDDPPAIESAEPTRPGTAAEPADAIPDGRDPEARGRRPRAGWRWLPAGVAAVAAAVLAALVVWTSHGVWWDRPSVSASQTQATRQRVLAAAKTCLAAVTNYDYRTLPADEAAGLACATGAFKASYKKAMETTVKTFAPQSKTAQTFQLEKAGIVSVSPDGHQWVVLLYGQQSVTNATTGPDKPRLDLLSARVTLDLVNGNWLISALSQA